MPNDIHAQAKKLFFMFIEKKLFFFFFGLFYVGKIFFNYSTLICKTLLQLEREVLN